MSLIISARSGARGTDSRASTAAEGVLTAPSPMTLAVTRLLARTQADHLVSLLDEQDGQAQRDAIYGRYYRGCGKNPASAPRGAVVSDGGGRPPSLRRRSGGVKLEAA
ncbi:hypothetical protein QMK19_08620 [Streptomyces sp. H10-C2]|uniref:hypothetical protein n=1 Tax=unclassified Streptomyces TaxID=2593676 RepID=UPI0024B89678|nr:MULTISPECIES: hypothetical protein [unclassified Streptomyces]MDJ0341029.1 hypothetical protein [Streptomyces sp. PH10-H1]MDJ0369739.1 hypothetical protein [Streptomyces sp. H10-C2]